MNESVNGMVALTDVSSLHGVEDLREVRMREADDRVRSAVVDRDAVELPIDEGGARKDDVRHVADLLVRHLRRKQVVAAASQDVPRLVEVEERRPHRVHEAVA